MKLKLLLPVSMLMCSFAFAQNDVDQNLQDYKAKIDSIVTAEKIKMNNEMDIADADFEKGKITNDQKIALKSAIAKKYEEIINEKVDTESTNFQNITKEAAKNSVFRKESDTAVFSVKWNNNSLLTIKRKKDSNPAKHLNKNDIAVSYGFLNLTEKEGSFNPFENSSKMRIGNSHSFEVQARKERQLGGFESPFFIRYGLAYRNDTYMPKMPLVTEQNTENIFLSEFTKGTVKRSKLRNVYLTFPVEFQWVLNPSYADYEGKRYLDNQKKQFKIGLGAYAGIRLRSIAKVKYYNEDGKFRKDSFTLDNGVNSFLFGAKLSLSYGGFNLFIKKDLTPIFNNDALLPNKNGIQIGIDILDLNF